ncbi:transcription factor TFIID complex subunit Taf13 [Lophiostoma macrostomum CBS 122681]|uniref:Transcription initiation factor TFIID subunit 13 n=1 Tax=Lophiostoma macrostomum CBS 122681 TaxID=1314788 RepID=A0A6A6TQN0_9PLEO|nr:transcription factor TFIID complex subunit Taf13 [Lophiostoma macrostomum CBS 122681]
MTEPRMRLRQKGQQFPTQELESFLVAYGDDCNPLPETYKVLDEIVTDYIIESCHEAASVAHHARRAKIKLDDFKFMLRRDTTKLGRVSEMLDKEKELKLQRKAFDTHEDAVAKDTEKDGDGDGGDGDGGKAGETAKSDAGKRGATDDGEQKKKKRKKNKGGDDASTVRSG